MYGFIETGIRAVNFLNRNIAYMKLFISFNEVLLRTAESAYLFDSLVAQISN